MPCWEINKILVDFKVNNIDLLEQAINNLNYNYVRSGRVIKIGNNITIDLDMGTVETRSTFSLERIDALKREYSELAVKEAAKKAKWLCKQRSKTKFEIRRY